DVTLRSIPENNNVPLFDRGHIGRSRALAGSPPTKHRGFRQNNRGDGHDRCPAFGLHRACGWRTGAYRSDNPRLESLTSIGAQSLRHLCSSRKAFETLCPEPPPTLVSLRTAV